MNALVKAAIQALAAKLGPKLGHCPKCMRQSFLVMLVAWGVTGVLAVAAAGVGLAGASAVAAGCLTLLWLGHVAAFALRSARNGNVRRGIGNGGAAPPESPVGPRRRFMLAFVRSAAFAATATAFPYGSVFAATCRCSGSTPKCCWSYDAKYYVCAPRDAVCCGHPKNPWFCNSDQSCNGDGSTRPKCR